MMIFVNILTVYIKYIGVGDAATTAKELGRDYKNVHTDVRKLEYVGLIDRAEDGKIRVPWDVVEAKLMLAA